MERIPENTNYAELKGIIVSMPEFNHKSYGEAFYALYLGVERKSKYMDVVQIIVSERLLINKSLCIDDVVYITGQVRTYNEMEEGRNRLNVVVFAREFLLVEDATVEDCFYENIIQLEGFICKEPIKRVSPLGREICDLMVAVNRMYNKSDYVPCIAWGRNAAYASEMAVGTKINISGRLQSREYRKKDENDNILIKTAYEVSILKIEA